MSGAKNRLLSELKTVQNINWMRVEASDDIFSWRVALLVINNDSDFAGAYLPGELRFPSDYPFKPPKFTFRIPLFHPNVYKNGRLCISILHNPGDDAMSGEEAGERWSPLQGVESVLLSTLLLLDNPEINSPANVDASVMYRDNREAYRERAAATVKASKELMPKGFVMPTVFEEPPKPAVDDDAAFWAGSDNELDFDSGSDQEMDFDGDENEEDGDDAS